MKSCGVQGCGGTRATGLPTCRPCWSRAPEKLREAMWRAYRNGGTHSRAYMRARDRLLAAIPSKSDGNQA